MALTICCVLVKGEYPYTPEYVRRLKAMTDRFCARPFRFVCLTDQPQSMPPGVEAIPIEKFDVSFACWSKLQVFDPKHGFSGRMLYIDLDSLVVAPLDPIIDFPADFALTEDAFVIERAHLDVDRRTGRRLVRRFNSSVMVWNGGEQTDLYTKWTPSDAERLLTDQDYVGEQSPHAQALPLRWFPRISRVLPPWPDETKVVLVKKPKCHIWADTPPWCDRAPWFKDAWGGWAA